MDFRANLSKQGLRQWHPLRVVLEAQVSLRQAARLTEIGQRNTEQLKALIDGIDLWYTKDPNQVI